MSRLEGFIIDGAGVTCRLEPGRYVKSITERIVEGIIIALVFHPTIAGSGVSLRWTMPSRFPCFIAFFETGLVAHAIG